MVRLSVPAVRRPTDPGILFAPSQRDGNAGRRLEGRGPWEITVLLPFRAPPGPYRATIRQADGTASVVLDTVVETADESTHLVAPASLGSGHYLLTLGPRDGARDSYLYGFDVAASP
jgi:hypothetical protein